MANATQTRQEGGIDDVQVAVVLLFGAVLALVFLAAGFGFSARGAAA